MTKRVVILGAGHAGCQLAFALRENGFQEEITLVNGEDALPYHRPPLSKTFLRDGRRDELLLRGAHSFVEHGVQMLSGVADAILPSAREVRLRSGELLQYDHLVLALGTLNRALDIPGGDAGVMYLKSLVDAELLRDRLKSVTKVVVIGAGFIGLEFAALAASCGKTVHVVDRAGCVMGRTASEVVSGYFQRRHEGQGVRFHLGVGIASLVRPRGAVTAISLSSGEVIEADLVVAGLGVIPHTAMAEAAGLVVDNGVVVDSHLVTSDSAISAIGDCACFPTPHARGLVRLESIQNANDHARTVARRLTGNVQPYTALPWFWSDQGADKLQIAGLPGNADLCVVRGQPEQNRFSVFSFLRQQLISVESVNQPADHMLARKLILAGVEVPPAMAADTSARLSTLIH